MKKFIISFVFLLILVLQYSFAQTSPNLLTRNTKIEDFNGLWKLHSTDGIGSNKNPAQYFLLRDGYVTQTFVSIQLNSDFKAEITQGISMVGLASLEGDFANNAFASSPDQLTYKLKLTLDPVTLRVGEPDIDFNTSELSDGAKSALANLITESSQSTTNLIQLFIYYDLPIRNLTYFVEYLSQDFLRLRFTGGHKFLFKRVQ